MSEECKTEQELYHSEKLSWSVKSFYIYIQYFHKLPVIAKRIYEHSE